MRRYLEAVLARFRAEGTHRLDEIIRSALPPSTSRWLLADLCDRVGRVTGMPVTLLVAEHQAVAPSADLGV
jgi:hypothetical protein